jgi:type IV pilus assembly protein PilB
MSQLIDVLLKDGLVTSEQVTDAKDKQIGAKKPLHDVLIEMGFLNEKDLLRVASKQFNMETFDLSSEEAQPEALKLLSYEEVKKYGVLPLKIEGDTLLLVMSNPMDLMALDDIKSITDNNVKVLLGSKSDIEKCIEKHYLMDDNIYDLLKNMTNDSKLEVVEDKESNESSDESEALNDKRSPASKLVNLIFSDATKARASDIHIEPFEHNTVVRYRIDGFLKNIMKVPKNLHPPFVSRIKILSNLDITETRNTQDGRCKIKIGDNQMDVRISTIPTLHGEKIVIRLLDTKESQIDINGIGFEEKELSLFKDAVKKPQGMILVTGPTGSGKTSTIYSALQSIKAESKNIITIEDPVEYSMEGINQIQLNSVKDVTFASGLRSILRQDPDVILVGEIRDLETAEIAFRASLTGHLVFSTLHTNNSFSTVVRLRDIGLEPFLIADSINLIVAQRLIRLICSECKEECSPDGDLLKKFGSYIKNYKISTFYRGKGCEECKHTGYRGRTAIFEILSITENIKKLIGEEKPEKLLLEEARNNGFKKLEELAFEKIAQDITTLEEIDRVCSFKSEGPLEEDSIKGTEDVKKVPTILIVDDEDDIRLVLKKHVIDAGYDVQTAKNGEEAVRLVNENKPNLIIMDWMMPVIDGLAATKILRSKLETASIPIVMLTAKKDKESELSGIDAGADDYITKPFDDEKLLARVKMILNRR